MRLGQFKKFLFSLAVLALAAGSAWAADAEQHAETAAAHVAAHGEAVPAAGHAEHAEHDSGGASMHLPNFINVLYHAFPGNPAVHFLHEWENIIFSLLVAFVIGLVGYLAAKRSELVPRGVQNVFEFAAESLDNFVTGILGERWRKFTPFVGSLWLYIFLMNFSGIIPGLKSSTSSFGITFPLGIAVFCYVQYTGIRELGLLKYVDHLAGSPRDIVGFILIPLMLFLHVVGEFVKPLSLSLRLFGNIWGEDVLIAVFVGMGSKMFVPLHFPFLFLALLTSFVQATVFCLLTTIYIALMLPHEHEHEHEEVHEAAHAAAGHQAVHH